MKTTIDLTNEQMHFLKLFAQNQGEGSEDNLGTRRPLFIVQSAYWEPCTEDDADRVLWYLTRDASEYENLDALVMAYYNGKPPIPLMDYEDAYAVSEVKNSDGEPMAIFDESDYLTCYGLDEEAYGKAYTKKRYRDIAYFFILAEAREYLTYQAHNLNNPRVYGVTGGYSNKGEYENFYDLLMTMGKNLLEEGDTNAIRQGKKTTLAIGQEANRQEDGSLLYHGAQYRQS